MAANENKLQAIRTHFTPLLGKPITRYQTAEILYEDGTWESWPDLPIRIYADQTLVSVSWSRFDDLWLSNDESLPFVAKMRELAGSRTTFPSLMIALGDQFMPFYLGVEK